MIQQKGDFKYSVPSLRVPTVVQHHHKSTWATPPPGGSATSHTLETSVPPSALHPEAPPIISSQEAISTEQKNHGPNPCRDSARRPVFPVCPAPTTAGSAKMNEALAQHFWILPRTNRGSKENVLFDCSAESYYIHCTCHYKGKRHFVWHCYIKLYDSVLERARLAVIYYVSMFKFNSSRKQILAMFINPRVPLSQQAQAKSYKCTNSIACR